MKISEITLTKQMKHIADKSGDYVDWLERRAAPDMLKHLFKSYGWHLLGTGAEGTVAEHPQKAYVLKVFQDNSYYQYFVEFVKQHAHNPHVPRFGRYVRKVPGSPFLYVRMEKLTSVDFQVIRRKYLNYLLDMKALGAQVGIRTLGHQLDMEMDEFLHSRGISQDDFMNAATRKDIMKKTTQPMPTDSWGELIIAMLESSKHLNLASWDMHEGNFMMRHNTLVIVDPWYSED